MDQIIKDVSSSLQTGKAQALPSGVSAEIQNAKTKVTVLDDFNKIVRYDEVLSEDEMTDKEVDLEKQSRDLYKD